MSEISTIILTYNEEKHIQRCIYNAQKFSKEIFVVDSFSTDKTREIAESLGVKVYQNKWENNHAKQFNWGLKNLPITCDWVFRLDADEYLSEKLIEEINIKVPTLTKDITGVIFLRKMIFLGKTIEKGNIDWYMLRLFRKNFGECENRWMDEHIILKEGKSIKFNYCFYDDNRNPLGWWIDKHNSYSIREAVDLLNLKYNLFFQKDSELSAEAKAKRVKKHKYAKLPLFWRSFIYFVYRFFFKLGFMEGKEGFLWHFLQGFWYRTLVDAKIYEIEKYAKGDVEKMKNFIKNNYNINI